MMGLLMPGSVINYIATSTDVKRYGRTTTAGASDLAGTAMPPDFDWLEYRERDYVSDVSRLETA